MLVYQQCIICSYLRYGLSSPSDRLNLIVQRTAFSRLARLQQEHDLEMLLDVEQIWIDQSIDRWVEQWCPLGQNPSLNWQFRNEALVAKLLLYARILAARSRSVRLDLARKDVAGVAIEIFERALEQPYIPVTVKSGAYVFAAGVIRQFSSRQDLVLRLALRMAGDPHMRQLNTFVVHNGQQMLSRLT
jgi:hypothetical protein